MARVKPSTVMQKQVYRYTFDMRAVGIGSVMLHTLLLNPEDMSQDEPARNGVTQTLGGVYITDFGSGLPTVDISGTTGYGKRTSAEGLLLDGYEEFVRFRQDVYRNFIAATDPKLSLYWYNWEDSEFYEIQPHQFRLQRNKGSGPLYRYSMRFSCLRRLTETPGQVQRDYLLSNPSTHKIAAEALTIVSNLGELNSALTGNMPVKFVNLPKNAPTFLNFPVLRNEQANIGKLMDYMIRVNAALTEYNQGRADKIDLNMDELTQNITLCRDVCGRIGTASKVPQDFLAELRKMQTQLQSLSALNAKFGKSLVGKSASEGSGI